ncbi:MAG TPA: septal ring lytic transglycosylase RlpA family protein [Steroidobacteraceae bacterium]|nr:septal ring lytic transglycosylase RlpA family protein [Steroidobacteraceae bacterium]
MTAVRPAVRSGGRATAAALLALAACSVNPRRAARPPAPLPPPPADLEAIPDAVPRVEPRSAHGNPPFYDVDGRRYFVLSSAAGYDERGVASWYGPTFHGANTSSGEPYNMYAMTAAHKTLPLPTYARVTNLSNGRSVVVRINDRGPFVGNRIIDLSYTAAAKLDMLRDGTAMVEVHALTAGAPDVLTRNSQSPPPTLYVQTGAFADPRNAERELERLHAAGLERAFVLSPIEGESRLFRVRIGPVSSVAEFDQLAARLATLGIPDARLVSE